MVPLLELGCGSFYVRNPTPLLWGNCQDAHAAQTGAIPGLTEAKMSANYTTVSVASVAQLVRAWDS